MAKKPAKKAVAVKAVKAPAKQAAKKPAKKTIGALEYFVRLYSSF